MKSKEPTKNSPNPRREAARILQRVLQDDAFANRLLDVSIQTYRWDPRDAGLLTELVYGVLRRLNRLDGIIDQLARKGIKSLDPFVLFSVRIALYQMIYLDRIPDHAALSEAVHAVRKRRGRAVGGFVNAMLRKFQRSPETFLASSKETPAEHLAEETSHPLWLVERYIERYGDEAQERLEQNNQQAPLTLRVHPQWGTRDRMFELLNAKKIQATPTVFAPEGVFIAMGQSQALQSFMRQHPTAWSVQDEAAQLLAHWLDPQAGEEILDACAAPGGKTTHLAALAPQAQVTALDIHEHKISLIQQACRRLQIKNVQAVQHDATQPLNSMFDRILCDAPCSGLGILRRQPEIRYRREPADLKRLQELQLRILNNLVQALKPGGRLLFSVCTDTHEENQEIVELFLEQNSAMQIIRPTHHALDWSTLLDEKGFFRGGHSEMDGFFAVCFQKD